ncbi:MAG: ACP S-malonyltransferase [Phycisphaerales bacterium]|nr:MAG: ACP S-malonyltransferase [Phycisphaerales bacterium]
MREGIPAEDRCEKGFSHQQESLRLGKDKDMSSSAVIFPGQGSQSVGMGRDVAVASKRARVVFDRANDLLGFDLAELCFEGPADQLEKTDIQQPAIFVVSVAIWEAFIEAGGRREQFAWTGGLSLGEYTALHVAGAVEFGEALRLVRRRGQLMQEASVVSPSGMVSLVGADEASARALCDRARGDAVLAPANFNCPGQVVISGNLEACDRAAELASEYGCRAVALPVAGAFHSPLMEPAARGLEPVLTETEFKVPMLAVVSNVDAEKHGEPITIRDSLRRQMTQPVLWQRCAERMIAEGVDQFFEMGPGRVLSGLIRKIDRKIPTVSVNTTDAITGATDRLAARSKGP